jgi:hypothetical protein
MRSARYHLENGRCLALVLDCGASFVIFGTPIMQRRLFYGKKVKE